MSNSDQGPENHELDFSSVPVGELFRSTRQSAGLSLQDVADRLKLRKTLIDAMEREDLTALGAPVFARGFVMGYAELLGLPVTLADRLFPAEQVTIAAPLHSTRKISHHRYLLDRYARRLVYIALTASIVVPIVLLATHDHLPDPATLLTPLDVQPGELAGETSSLSVPPSSSVADQVGPPEVNDHAVMASFTPFYNQQRPVLSSPPPAPVAVFKGLVLEVTGESWVEVMGTDGTRLAHNLLRTGDRLEFEAGKVANVVLGNAAAVTAYLDGEKVDLSPFQRANVARFAVSSEGSLVQSNG